MPYSTAMPEVVKVSTLSEAGLLVISENGLETTENFCCLIQVVGRLESSLWISLSTIMTRPTWRWNR